MSAWQQMSERFRGLKDREKYMVFFGSLLLVFWLFSSQIIAPIVQDLTKAEKQLAAVIKSQKQQLSILDSLQQQANVNLDASYAREVEELQRQELDLQEQVSSLTSYFVGSERMAQVLQDVLKSSNNVKIKSVMANPPVPLTFADQGSDNKAVIYQHSTLVVLSGDFFALSSVLRELDNLKWSLGWQSLDYKVSDYPSAELTLHLLTVSDNESYIKL